MFDKIDKLILFAVSKSEEGKTKYQISQETGIPYSKLEYRIKTLKDNGYILTEKSKKGKKDIELYTASEKLVNFDKLILAVDKNNLFVGSTIDIIFKNIKMEVKNGKLKLTSDYS